MEKEQLINALKALAQISPKRNFKQRYDLVINLKDLDMKKPENHVELFITLPYPTGKKITVGCLVGPELAEQARATCKDVITQDQFKTLATGDKKVLKKLANKIDYFIAQATIMPDVAKTFGRVFGPRGKMPNPKAGCVVPPNANLKLLVERLGKTIKVSAKVQPSIKCAVGTEPMTAEQIAENVMAVYKQVVDKLPNEKNNIKNVMLKLTMGKPVKVGEKIEVKAEATS